jgi:DNA repair protein RadC
VLSIAHDLLARFGSVEALLAADATTLMSCHGVGPAKAALLKAVHELTMRHAEERFTDGSTFTDVNEVSKYLQRRIGHSERELFGCMFLDTRHRLLAWDVLFAGSINRTHVHAREVLKRALQLNSAAIVLAHNHPSGIAEPSQADLLLTRDLTDLMARVDIRIIDHIIVTGGHTVSFAARGLLG